MRVEVLHGQKTKDCTGKVPVKKRKCCSDVKLTVKTDNAKKDIASFAMAKCAAPVPDLFFYYDFFRPTYNRTVVTGSRWPKGPPLDLGKSPIYLLTRSILV